MGFPGASNLFLLDGSRGYEIEQSLRFNSADSAYLNRTPASAGDRKTWTWSAWVKRGKIGTSGFLFYTRWASGNSQGGVFFAGDTLRYFARVSGSDKAEVYTTSVFRDPSAWYHVVAVLDAANTSFKFYVNNVEQPLTTVTAVQNADHAINHPEEHNLGKEPTASDYFDGYMAEVHFIDGSALDPTSFGELDNNGVWRPIKYAGSYTGNSFYLKFVSGDGTDSSGLSNTWTANNFTTSGTGTDVMSDTPTTNWCTLNPLDAAANNGIADGNLKCGTTTAANTTSIRATQAVSSGKWYFEVQKITTGSINIQCGWAATNLAHTFDTGDTGVYGKAISGTTVMIAADFDNNAIWTGIDGTWDNSATTAEIEAGTTTNAAHTGVANYPLAPMFLDQAGSFSGEANFNFGQRDFAYTPPTGFKALNTANLPAPDIADGSDYFNTVLWTGNSTDDRNIPVADNSGNTWQPDLVWIKARITAYLHQHELYDAVRGATKRLQTNDTAAEDTAANNMQAFNSDGFQVGTASSVNASSDGYVAWNWLAGGSGSSNTDGTVTSTVSANPTAGFSIVRWSNQGTVGHGLGVAPSFIIVKSIDQTSGWWVYATALGNSNYGIPLHSTAGQNTGINWGGAPTSTVFYVSSGNGALPATSDNIAYCFAEVDGYCKASKYTGNGSSDGPLVYTGFAPAFLLIGKTSSGAGWNWQLRDSKRPGYNVNNDELRANSSAAELSSSAETIDFLSNGFKPRSANGATNQSGYTYIYLALAENPFGGSGVSPATAR